MWLKVRVGILLLILAVVAQQAILKDGAPNWKRTLYVNIYPINGDASIASTQTITSLNSAQLDDLNAYFKEEASRYGLPLGEPFSIRWGDEVKAVPPKLILGQIAWRNMLNTAIWSLKFRWWAHNHSPQTAMPADIRLYVLYHNPADQEILEHSTALNKGRIGIVNAFASSAYTKQNNVIIAHELAHTVGATDKYNLTTNQPLYPAGFAQPEQSPLYPQTFAELMAGRTPMSDSQAEIPQSLTFTIIGGVTAKEIGWLRSD